MNDVLQPAGSGSPDPGFPSRVRGCLLGGSLGDQLGHPVTASSREGIRLRYGAEGLRSFGQLETARISGTTQLALYTVDALLEALEWANAGTAADETACLWLAYLRWYAGQEGGFPDAAPQPLPRWIDAQQLLQERRSPSAASLAALATGEMGSRARPINADTDGADCVARSAPFGLLPRVPAEMVRRLALDGAALTHGRPAAQQSAAAFSSLVHVLVHQGAAPADAATAVLAATEAIPAAAGLAGRLKAALRLGQAGPVPAEAVSGELGAGLEADEALAVALYAVLAGHASDPQEHFRAALALAVNIDGDSSCTGSIAGSLLGAYYGEAGLPPEWLAAAEGTDEVNGMAGLFLAQTVG
ncbi:ADP-ribosylglycohydrolase [Arthrobacter crystallopoietes BAB-32]|uniref:ADP-ribosylglycohydrolase n=1 Tax=Arthrobacter crystallopoietes BAB-32 TaxID=1246476 RepID=N1V3N3_9MICC|nr:ADP-ribosylglycohydrolase family protein [Arthrobacter crystallopoietes]EMY34682.1 ADP-ribosylglycohydrolase [Arthrobacter crystallopoietes BAB-32]